IKNSESELIRDCASTNKTMIYVQLLQGSDSIGINTGRKARVDCAAGQNESQSFSAEYGICDWNGIRCDRQKPIAGQFRNQRQIRAAPIEEDQALGANRAHCSLGEPDFLP